MREFKVLLRIIFGCWHDYSNWEIKEPKELDTKPIYGGSRIISFSNRPTQTRVCKKCNYTDTASL